jgi:hypothetical protein
MSTIPIRFADLVEVVAGFKPSVQLPTDFEHADVNNRLVEHYIPTNQTLDLFTEIARSFNPSSTERARTLVGTYGTGKSDLLLMLCNYFSRPVDDPVMQPFYEKLKSIDDNQHQYNTIRDRRADKPPFLVVLLQADATTPFPGFVLHGLHEALIQIGLEDLMSGTKYQAAQEQIAAWQHESHARLNDFCITLREREGRELDRLVADLGSAQADLAFPIFTRTFKAVTGSDFNVYGYSQPHETYIIVARKLREQKSHSGILIVCDEFTEFLRRFEQAIDQRAGEIDAETKAVENLAERSATSGDSQIHFIVASLEGFSSASTQSGTAQAGKAVERTGGRFKHHSLDIQRSEELIRGAIHRLPAASTTTLLPNPQRDTLMEIATALWKLQSKNKEWIKSVVVDGTFPLHPLTTYALPLVNQRVAQSQRTMFLFLNDDRGLRGFIQRAELASSYPDWHNLLTLDMLFDYFQDSIQTKKSDLEDVYEHSHQRLHNATVDTTLAERILKIVALCEVVPDPNLRPTRVFLRQALNIPPTAEGDLHTALSILEETEALYPPGEAESEDTGIYSLPMPGRASTVNLRQRVKQRAATLETSVQRLQSRYSAKPVSADTYNRTRGSHRELAAHYVDGTAFQFPGRIKADLDRAGDGLIYYVVATSDSERAEAQSKAREFTAAHENLVVAVPTAPLNILRALCDYIALEDIRSDPELDAAARKYLEDHGQVGRGYKAALDTELSRLHDVRQWEWFVGGGGRSDIGNQASLVKLADRLMEKRFPHTPRQTLSQHFRADTISTSLERAITELLKRNVQISKGAGAMGTILSKGIGDLGLLKSQGTTGGFEVYEITDPPAGDSKIIWERFQAHLAAGKSWASLVTMVRNPPYGLYDSLLIVYTAAFLVRYAEAVEVLSGTGSNQQSLPIDVKLLKDMLGQPKNYTIRYHPLTEAELRWLRGIVTHGLQKQLDYSTSGGKTLRETVAEQVQTWTKRLGLPLFAENLTVEHLQELVPDADPASIQVGLLIMRSNREKHAFASQILNDIPTRFEAPDNHNTWTDATVDELLARCAEVCRLLEQLPDMLKNRAVARIAATFGAEQQADEAHWNTIYQWRRSREVVRPQSLNTVARSLFHLTNDPTGSVDESLLNEFAYQVVGINARYKSWREYDRLDALLQAIERAKQEIDTQWEQAAPAEEVWLNGLATAALGRDVNKATAPQVAEHLTDWASSRTWPACVTALKAEQVQQLYPIATPEQSQDIVYLLRRTKYQAPQWEPDITEEVAKQFGIQNWRKQEVQDALARFETALREAANIDTLLRQHILTRLAVVFSDSPTLTTAEAQAALSDIVINWRDRHPIPAQHDLSPEAGVVLHQVSSGIDALETTLLIDLPRALPGIDQSYQQWGDYARLEQYITTVERAVQEINVYVPLTDVEYQWLTGLVEQGLQQPLQNDSREQTRLVQGVSQQLNDWLRALNLPAFCTTLSEHDLRDLFPEAEAMTLTTGKLLIDYTANATVADTLLLTTLPATLGIDRPSQQWEASDVEALITQFKQVCQMLTSLNTILAQQVYAAIGATIDANDPAASPGTLLSRLHAWRDAHVLLRGEELSPDARALFQALQQNSADPRALLLERLPQQLREVQAPYGQWATWQTRNTYVDVLRKAVQEIEEKGRVRDATPRAQELWETFRHHMEELTPDERRWLIKQFNEAFHA